MTRRCYKTLDENRTITKCRGCFGNSQLQLFVKFLTAFNNTHPFSTATCRSFNQYGKPNFFSNFSCSIHIANCFFGSGNQRDFISFGSSFGGQFRPHHFHGLRRRTNKRDSSFLHRTRKSGIFGKKSIARMNAINSQFFTHFDNLISS